MTRREWNIYAAQASDGDNWADDSPQCARLLGASNYCLCALLRLYRNYSARTSELVAGI
ncbi:MAG: DUF444 family protein [Rheinheimera sp.]|nr:DUF444 family protein [Rheinheimera sp.]